LTNSTFLLRKPYIWHSIQLSWTCRSGSYGLTLQILVSNFMNM